MNERISSCTFIVEYMDRYINPPEYIEEQKERVRQQQEISERYQSLHERDILKFLIHKAPLKSWQQDVLSIVRKKPHILLPQGMTKIMNEGWASYWHSRLMTEKIMDEILRS